MTDLEPRDVRGEALEALLTARTMYLESRDPDESELLSERFVKEVFELAWGLQFERDRGAFDTGVRHLLSAEGVS